MNVLLELGVLIFIFLKMEIEAERGDTSVIDDIADPWLLRNSLCGSKAVKSSGDTSQAVV